MKCDSNNIHQPHSIFITNVSYAAKSFVVNRDVVAKCCDIDAIQYLKLVFQMLLAADVAVVTAYPCCIAATSATKAAVSVAVAAVPAILCHTMTFLPMV